MAIMKEPALKAKWPPPGGHKYKVTPGEHWGSIANRDGWSDPWGLIEFNFGLNGRTDKQLDSMYVNWYLKNYVGCTLETSDRKNYRFDGSDPLKPEHIYTKNKLKGDELGDHLPLWARGSNRIPVIKQAADGWDCWLTAAAMMLTYRYGRKYTQAEAAAYADTNLKGYYTTYSDLYTHKTGLHVSRAEQFARACGMTPVRFPFTSLGFWYIEIMRYGPVAVLSESSGIFHARVLHGISGDGGFYTNMHLIDPWPWNGGKTTELYNYFQAAYEDLYLKASYPVVWRWPGHA